MSSSSKPTGKSQSGLIHEFDMFGETIIFTFNGKSTMKTSGGVCASLLLISIGAFMFIFMGQSFFFKTSPVSMYSTMNLDSIPIIRTIQKNNFLAIRIGSTSTKYAIDGKLFTLTAYLTNPKKTPAVTPLPVTSCESFAGADINYMRQLNILYKNYYCVSLASESFGGAVDDTDYSYIQMSLNVCDAARSTVCNKAFAPLLIQSSTPLLIDVYYPQIFYNPNDWDKPFKVQHISVTDSYTSYQWVDRRFYIKQSNFTDDKGWLLADEKTVSAISVGSTSYSNTYKTNQAELLVFKGTFYATAFVENYSRKFQKLQDVIAVVGGFLRICQIVLAVLIFHYTKYVKSMRLINGLINWKRDGEESAIKAPKNQIKSITQELSALPSIADNINRNNVERPSVRKRTRNMDGTNTDTPDMSHLKLKDNISNINLDKRIEDQDNSQVDLHISKNKSNLRQLEESVKSERRVNPLTAQGNLNYQLTIGEVMKRALCRRCLGKRQTQRVKLFDIGDHYVRGILDVFGYMDLVIEVNNLKTALLNTFQRKCFNFYEKPTFFINEEMDDKKIGALQSIMNNNRGSDDIEERKKITEYYAYRLFNNTANHVDHSLIKQLDHETSMMIVKRLEEVKNNVKNGKNPEFDQLLINDHDEN
jgi:hypothetical protein